jgi:hypothetical protein
MLSHPAGKVKGKFRKLRRDRLPELPEGLVFVTNAQKPAGKFTIFLFYTVGLR